MTERVDFDWDAYPVERQYDSRVWGGIVLKLADGSETYARPQTWPGQTVEATFDMHT